MKEEKITEKPNEKQDKDQLGFIEHIRSLFDIQSSTDIYGTINSIKKNVSLKGTDAWLLLCSIIIASIGLDLNSPAVIIGGMLISPLMSPILGIGLSIAINDRKTLKLALRNFGLSTVITLITSILYFSITPIGDLSTEIMSRTQPTTLDVLIAFFGGVAGVISISRKEISNAIPGVAIATALMPPLCVSGFGIAHGNMSIAVNSFYLFFLNAVFVALATYLIIRLLKFPLKEHINPADNNRAKFIILFFVLLIIIPSGFILFDLYQQNKEKQAVDQFIGIHFNKNPKALEWKVIKTSKGKQIYIQVLGKQLSNENIDSLGLLLTSSNLTGYHLDVNHLENVSIQQLEKLQTELNNFQYIGDELNSLRKDSDFSHQQLDSLIRLLADKQMEDIDHTRIIQQMKIAFHNLDSITLVDEFNAITADSFAHERYFLVEWKKSIPQETKQNDLERIIKYIKTFKQYGDYTIKA